MNNSPNLRRIRRVAAGISVAAILAVAGFTVETAWEQGAFGADAAAAGGASVRRIAVPMASSVVPQQASHLGERTQWLATPPVHNSHRPPHANTAGS